MSVRLFMQKIRPVPARRWAVIGLGALSAGLVLFGLRWCFVTWQVHSARQALSEGNPSAAVAALRQAESVDPHRAEVAFLLGRALRRAGKLGEAASYLERSAAAGWPMEEVRLQRELLLVQSGAFAPAGDFQEEFLSKGASDDTAEEIYEARAKGFYSTYRLGDALLCLEFWLKWRPHARQARIWRGEIYERLERLPEAGQDYRAILEHDPQDVEVRIRLAETMLPRNDAQGALAEFETCLKIRPNDAAALRGRLKCLRRLGELEGVNEGLTALLDRELSARDRADVLYELGEMSLYNKAYHQAIDYLTRSRQADPTYMVVDQSLSIAYARLGMTELAEETKQRCKQSLARGSRLADITRQMLREPRDPELRYEAGMILMAEGLKKEAAAWLKTALDCDPSHRRSHAAMADYLAEIGDPDGAAQHRKLAGAPGKREQADARSGRQ
jgi:tetratricopeptide (TPR) repeat protein